MDERAESIAQKREPLQAIERISALDFILPPQVIPLILLLFIVLPIVCLTLKSLFLAVFPWLQINSTLFSSGNLTSGPFPMGLLLKIVAFFLLSFFGCFQLIQRIKSIYLCTWVQAFERPHPLHIDYQSHFGRAMIGLLRWSFFQFLRVVLPPVFMIILTAGVGALALYLFTVFSDLPFIMLSFQITTALFIIIMLGMLTLATVINSIWVTVHSIFGDVIAVTEPSLPASLVLERCKRIAYASPLMYLLIFVYVGLLVAVLLQASWLMQHTDINALIALKADIPLILLAELITLASYLLFNFLKLFGYHQGLIRYYHLLPVQLKSSFSPPPAATL
ncbi:MAG: hypothetical protein AAGI66_06050 [Cyanobacteria bacterium P01_H01_bin.74]